MRRYLFVFIAILAMNISVVRSQSLSGTYTIGGTNPGYATISAAVSDLETNGISGAVTFNIAPGTYSEQVSIGSFTGASSTNTVVFQSSNQDSSAVIITHPSSATISNNYTIHLDGCEHVSFKHVTIKRTGTNTYSQVISIENSAENINFYHNHIEGAVVSSAATYKSLVYGSNNSLQSNITFDGNYFKNGSYGLWLLGQGQIFLDAGNEIINNHFKDQYFCGVKLSFQDAPKIESNLVESNSSASGEGISLFYCDNAVRVVKNTVSVKNGKGIYLSNSDGYSGQLGLLANNFISIGGGGTAHALAFEHSSSWNVYFNSLNNYNSNAASAAVWINGISVSNLDLKNNNFVNTGTGYSVYVSSNTNFPISTSDYNNLYSEGTNLAFYKSSGNQTTLQGYRSASFLEASSVNVDPLYISDTDLHAQSPFTENEGTFALSSLTPVSDDIDGQPRNSSNPDIGADEYSAIDIQMLILDTNQYFCDGNSIKFRIRLKNNAATVFNDSIKLNFRLNGQSIQTAYPVNNGMATIGANSKAFIVFASLTQSVFPATIQTAEFWTEVAGDVIEQNDSLISGPITVFSPPAMNLGQDFDLCDNATSVIDAGTGFNSYLWPDNSTAQTWQFDPTGINPGVHSVIAGAFDSRNCYAEDTVDITILEAPMPNIVVPGNLTDTICGLSSWTLECGNFQTYTWSDGSTNQNYPLPAQSYPFGAWYSIMVEVTASNGCTNSDTLAFYYENCLDINEIDQDRKVSVYPNPFSDLINVDIESEEKLKAVKIFDLNGRLVLVEEFDKEDFNKSLSLNTTGLKQGMYILELSFESGIYQHRLVHN